MKRILKITTENVKQTSIGKCIGMGKKCLSKFSKKVCDVTQSFTPGRLKICLIIAEIKPTTFGISKPSLVLPILMKFHILDPT